MSNREKKDGAVVVVSMLGYVFVSVEHQKAELVLVS